MNSGTIRPHRRSILAGLCAAGVTAGTFPWTPKASAQTESQLVAAAKQEGKVVLYTGSEESIIVNLGKAFLQKYGIPVEYQRLNSAEIGMRYSAEAQTGRTVADVVLTGDYEIFKSFSDKGWLAKLDASVPGLDKWPTEFQDEFTTTVSINAYSIAVNTKRMSATVADWQDLLRPDLAGEIITLDLKRVGLIAFAGFDFLMRRYGEDFLRKIGQQKLLLQASGPSAVQQLASGAGTLYIPCSMTQADSMISQGAPVKAILPDSGYTGVMTQAAISKNAPHGAASRLFVSLLMSDEGQRIQNMVASSPVSTPGTAPLKNGFVKPDFPSTIANRAKIIQLLGM